MNDRTLRPLSATAALALTVGLLAAAPAGAAKPVDQTRSASPNATVTVETLSGEVRIVGWSRNEVHVTGTIGDDVTALDVRGEGGRIEIEVDLPHGRSGRDRDYSVDLEISVPAGSQLHLESVSTSHQVRGLAGSVHVESVSGSLDLDGDPAEAKVQTVSGSVRVVGSPALLRTESVSGGIVVEGSSTNLGAETVSGAIRVVAGVVERCELGSVSGSIEFEGGLARGARFEVEGHSGGVDLLFNPDVSARFAVETFSGTIDNRLTSDRPRRANQYAPGYELDFTVGSGDASVEVESFSGSVTLRSR